MGSAGVHRQHLSDSRGVKQRASLGQHHAGLPHTLFCMLPLWEGGQWVTQPGQPESPCIADRPALLCSLRLGSLELLRRHRTGCDMTTPLPMTPKNLIFINKECTQTNIPLLLAAVCVVWQVPHPREWEGRGMDRPRLGHSFTPDTGHRHSCSLGQLEVGGAALGGSLRGTFLCGAGCPPVFRARFSPWSSFPKRVFRQSVMEGPTDPAQDKAFPLGLCTAAQCYKAPDMEYPQP